MTERARALDRGGVRVVEVDLTDTKLASNLDLLARGHSLRFLRHGSHPGARFELSFGGVKATDLFAPGMCIRGGFTGASVKRAKGGARVGKALLAVLSDELADLTEDLIINALGPVDLLGSTDVNGDPATGGWVSIPENTDPTLAYGNQTGAFDGAGWELLRVFLKATDITTADVHFFHNPSWVGSTWFHCTYDGKFSLEDSPTSGFDYRTFMVPWAGRGVGCPAVYNLLPGGLPGVDMIIQGVK